MFDLRLGLGLGKSLGEIHALPAWEVKLWQMFFMLEPWGWQEREYLNATQLAMQHNIHKKKSASEKSPQYFMRDRENQLMKELNTPEQKFDLGTEEGRADASNFVLENFMALFEK